MQLIGDSHNEKRIIDASLDVAEGFWETLLTDNDFSLSITWKGWVLSFATVEGQENCSSIYWRGWSKSLRNYMMSVVLAGPKNVHSCKHAPLHSLVTCDWSFTSSAPYNNCFHWEEKTVYPNISTMNFSFSRKQYNLLANESCMVFNALRITTNSFLSIKSIIQPFFFLMINSIHCFE